MMVARIIPAKTKIEPVAAVDSVKISEAASEKKRGRPRLLNDRLERLYRCDWTEKWWAADAVGSRQAREKSWAIEGYRALGGGLEQKKVVAVDTQYQWLAGEWPHLKFSVLAQLGRLAV
jgi:hypothetical protein